MTSCHLHACVEIPAPDWRKALREGGRKSAPAGSRREMNSWVVDFSAARLHLHGASQSSNEESNTLSLFSPPSYILLLDSSPAHWSSSTPGKLPLFQMARLPLSANICAEHHNRSSSIKVQQQRCHSNWNVFVPYYKIIETVPLPQMRF